MRMLKFYSLFVQSLLNNAQLSFENGGKDKGLTTIIPVKKKEEKEEEKVYTNQNLYAPTPKFILTGLLSFLKASVTPRIASGGPIATSAQYEAALQKKRAGKIIKFID